MKVDFTFRHFESSDTVTAYAQDRIEKISKFELKPMDIHFHFEMHKHECLVQVTVLEGRRKFQAHCVSNDFHRGIDNVVNKLSRQMSKDKRRVKNHHHRSAEATSEDGYAENDLDEGAFEYGYEARKTG